MEITSTITYRENREFQVIYRESDPDQNSEAATLQAVGAFCFLGDQLVLVYHQYKKYWTPPGGVIEEGESWQEAVYREVLEESNMEVLEHQLIGYQDVYTPEETFRQVRSFCRVEPRGEFVSDPDGDITAIKLIDPSEYKRYFNWGEVGERIMQRAMELKQNRVGRKVL